MTARGAVGRGAADRSRPDCEGHGIVEPEATIGLSHPWPGRVVRPREGRVRFSWLDARARKSNARASSTPKRCITMPTALTDELPGDHRGRGVVGGKRRLIAARRRSCAWMACSAMERAVGLTPVIISARADASEAWACAVRWSAKFRS